MKSSDMFSFKDYFNYYFAGVTWFLDFALLFLLVSGKWGIDAVLAALGKYSNDLGVLPGGVLVLVIPYIIGFTMSPVGERVKKLWQGKNRERFPDPKKYLNIYEDNNSNEKLSEEESSSINANRKSKHARESSSTGGEKHQKWDFFKIRAYVIEHGGEAKNLGIRARTLANLTESLLLPVPIAFALLASLLLLPVNTCAVILIAILVGSLTHWLLVNRYFQLERYWVKHFYRAFLVMQNKLIQENSHDPS